MHFAYLDETGCDGRSLENLEEKPIFIMGGLSAVDDRLDDTVQIIDEQILSYFGGTLPDRFELHSADLLSPNGTGFFSGHDSTRRQNLAKGLLSICNDRSHKVHLGIVDKHKLSSQAEPEGTHYDAMVPYFLGLDQVLADLNHFIKTSCGRSARGKIYLDIKHEFSADAAGIYNFRTTRDVDARRLKRMRGFITEIDSENAKLIQLADLIILCTRRFLEHENGYRNQWSEPIIEFYKECYEIIEPARHRKRPVTTGGTNYRKLDPHFKECFAKPRPNWRTV